MKKGLVMCRTGMGSSMMLCIKLNKIISKNNLPIELTHDVFSGASGYNADVIIVMNDLVDELKGTDSYVIGIKDITDTEYMENELKKFLNENGALI